MTDVETGKVYLRARYYDPITGRFIQEDSFRGDNASPYTLNLYVYCSNNPVMMSDPSGYRTLAGDGPETDYERAASFSNMYRNPNGSTSYKHSTKEIFTETKRRAGIHDKAVAQKKPKNNGHGTAKSNAIKTAKSIGTAATNSINIGVGLASASTGVMGYAGAKQVTNMGKNLNVSKDIIKSGSNNAIKWSESAGKRVSAVGYAAAVVDAGINAYCDYQRGYSGTKIAYDATINTVLDAGNIYAAGAIGGLIGTAIPIPGIGTAIGFLVGIGIGYAISAITDNINVDNNESIR